MIAGQGDAVQVAGVDRPHAAWWITVLGGMAFLAVLAFDAGAYAWWARLTTMLSQTFLRCLFAAAVLTHIIEAVYALRLARRHGLPAAGWCVQTFLLGFPSLRLLRHRVTV